MQHQAVVIRSSSWWVSSLGNFDAIGAHFINLVTSGFARVLLSVDNLDDGTTRFQFNLFGAVDKCQRFLLHLLAHVSPLLVVLLQSHPAVALSADTPWWVSPKALLRCRWFRTERDSTSWESPLISERPFSAPLPLRSSGTDASRPLWFAPERCESTLITWSSSESEETFMPAVKHWAGFTTRTSSTLSLKPPPIVMLTAREDTLASWGLLPVKETTPRWPSSSLFKGVLTKIVVVWNTCVY